MNRNIYLLLLLFLKFRYKVKSIKPKLKKVGYCMTFSVNKHFPPPLELVRYKKMTQTKVVDKV